MTSDDDRDRPVTDLPTGKDIQFLDHFIPSIRDGDYEIHVLQKLRDGIAKAEHELPANLDFKAKQRFTVRGPRFSLPGSDVHSQSPPASHRGQFEDDLPHIVLNKRGLPWERKLEPTKATPETPWMALLLLRADELLVNPEPKGLANPTRGTSFPIQQVLSGADVRPGPPGDTQGPMILKKHLSEDERVLMNASKLVCRTIDISKDTFEMMMPTLREAALLTHVRQVDTGDKEIPGIKDDGWFSVVVSNRFPKFARDFPAKPLHVPDTTPYVAHLVSLEGFEDMLQDDGPKCPAGKLNVRLVSLASWAFGVLEVPAESFADLMCGLIQPVLEGRKNGRTQDLMLRMPVPDREDGDQTETTTMSAKATQRLQDGYVPLSYRTRPGDRTFAWYRSPLVPEPAPFFLDATGDEKNRVPAATRAAEAYIYDPATGVFDLSYGVAFMTGRAQALADSVFSQNVMNWRRRMHEVLDLVHARINAEHLSGLMKNGHLNHVAAHELEELLEDRLTKSFVRKLVGELGDQVLPDGTTALPLAEPWNPPPAIRDVSVRQQLETVLSEPVVKSLLAKIPEALPEEIILWLAERMLLQNVPFDNLVPAARMLPPESIRFFHLDRNWLSCLIDGAFSVGTHTSRDTALYEVLRGPIHEAVYEIVHRLRDRLRGGGGVDKKAPVRLSGFLLRSALVSGWPGLEVKAFSAADGQSGELKLLRMERLSPDVMLVLFPDVPRCVQLNEPRESLGFGYEVVRKGGCSSRPKRNNPDKDVFELRHVSGIDNGKPLPGPDGKPKTVDVQFRPGTHVLNVNEMVARITEGIGPGEVVGPAAFAMNMVKVPEQMLFVHPGDQ